MTGIVVYWKAETSYPCVDLENLCFVDFYRRPKKEESVWVLRDMCKDCGSAKHGAIRGHHVDTIKRSTVHCFQMWWISQILLRYLLKSVCANSPEERLRQCTSRFNDARKILEIASIIWEAVNCTFSICGSYIVSRGEGGWVWQSGLPTVAVFLCKWKFKVCVKGKVWVKGEDFAALLTSQSQSLLKTLATARWVW